MLVDRERQKELDIHRGEIARKEDEVLQRRKEEQVKMAEEHEVKMAKQRVRAERREALLAEDRAIVLANQITRQERANVRQNRLAIEREAKAERQRAEAEAKKEYMKIVKAQLEVTQEERKREVWHRMKVHDEAYKKRKQEMDVEVKDRTIRREQQ